MVYRIAYIDSATRTSNETVRYFRAKDEIFDWASENGFTIRSIRFDLSGTAKYYASKFAGIGLAPGELSDKEILQLLKLLRNISKYKTDESRKRQILMNYADGDKRYKNLKAVLAKIAADMSHGIPLYRILGTSGLPKYISRALAVGQKAAEEIGVYDKLIDLIKVKYDTGRSISRMLVYPKIVFVAIYGYFLMAIFYQIPQTRSIMSMLDESKFPDISRTFYAWSEYALANPYKFVFLSALIAYASYKIGYKIVGSLARYMPYIRDIYIVRSYTLVTAMLSVATSASISLPEAIAFSAEVSIDDKLKKRLNEVALLISDRGYKFTAALEDVGFKNGTRFDLDFYNTVFAMETTSELSKGLEDLYQDYKDTMEDVLEVSKSFVNPIMMIVIAAAMILIFYAINAPLQTLGSKPF